MRVLLDSCMSGLVRDQLRDHGWDVVWSGEFENDPGDDELLALALRERRILVTLDKDFGELVVLKQRPHSGVLRLVGMRTSEHSRVCRTALDIYQAELTQGALVTVEPGRVRVRLRSSDYEGPIPGSPQ
jgi:predicted nuclease of predicted toxin-antitoxin system